MAEQAVVPCECGLRSSVAMAICLIGPDAGWHAESGSIEGPAAPIRNYKFSINGRFKLGVENFM